MAGTLRSGERALLFPHPTTTHIVALCPTDGIFFIFTLQYSLGIKPDLRNQIDYVVLCREPILANRKRLYEAYAGIIRTCVLLFVHRLASHRLFIL